MIALIWLFLAIILCFTVTPLGVALLLLWIFCMIIAVNS